LRPMRIATHFLPHGHPRAPVPSTVSKASEDQRGASATEALHKHYSMSDIATVEPISRKKQAAVAKRLRISKPVLKAIDLLISGECKTQKAACERVNISETWLSIQLNKPAIEVFVAQRARRNLSRGVMRASARMVELLDASSEHVSLDASKHVLALDGIKPPDSSQPTGNTTINVGYIVNLAAPSDKRVDTPSTLIER
jgi:hypothetical protein